MLYSRWFSLRCILRLRADSGFSALSSHQSLYTAYTSLLLASAETALFPGGLDQLQPRGRTAVWIVLGNLLYVGGSLAFGWFRGIPLWGGAVLVLILEAGFFAMWFGINVAMQADTADLNRRLRQYQQE